MKKIGFDLDDVIADCIPSLLEFYNRRYEKNLKFENIKSYNLWENGMGKTREDSVRIVDEFSEEEIPRIPLIKGAKEAIESLDGKIWIITSRHVKYKKATYDFVKKYFPMAEVIHSGDFHGNGIKKQEICKQIGIEFFVDDNYDYAFDCAKNGVNAFLFDKPWNWGKNGLRRVKNWGEILKNLNGVKNGEVFSRTSGQG